MVTPSRELIKLVHDLFNDLFNMVKEEGALGGNSLQVEILILDGARHHGIIHGPQFRDTTPRISVDEALCRSRGVDDIIGMTQKFFNQLSFGNKNGLHEVGGEKAVLTDGTRGQGKFGDLVSDKIEVRSTLDILGKELEKTGIIDCVIIIMAGMDVETGFGHGAASNIKDIGEAFSDGGIEGLVHIGDSLTRRKVGGPEPRHGHPCRNGGGGVFAFWFGKNKRVFGGV